MSIPEKKSGNKKTGKKVQPKEVQWNKISMGTKLFLNDKR